MLLDQDEHHWMARRVITSEGLGKIAASRLTSLHVDVFTDLSPDGEAAARRDYLKALFENLADAYRTALEEGYPEAAAREPVHIMANQAFWDHGWTEVMEFPATELEPHFERRREFFEAHDVTREDPLGAFGDEQLPDAPSTPEKREDPTFPEATGGYADDVYVLTGDGEVYVDGEQPEPDMSAADLPTYAAEMERKYDVSPSLSDVAGFGGD